MTTQKMLAPFMEPLVREYRSLRKWTRRMNRETADSLYLVGVWFPDEVSISRFIALLLDPSGDHGQGASYLRLLLQRLPEAGCAAPRVLAECDDSQLADATVHTEYPIYGARRIDVLVEIPLPNGESFVLGIENKPWAGESESQIADYSRGLSRRYGSEAWALLVFAGDGFDISVDEVHDEGRVVCAPYSRVVRKWIEACYACTEAPKLRFLLKDFSKWIETSFQPVEEQ